MVVLVNTTSYSSNAVDAGAAAAAARTSGGEDYPSRVLGRFLAYVVRTNPVPFATLRAGHFDLDEEGLANLTPLVQTNSLASKGKAVPYCLLSRPRSGRPLWVGPSHQVLEYISAGVPVGACALVHNTIIDHSGKQGRTGVGPSSGTCSFAHQSCPGDDVGVYTQIDRPTNTKHTRTVHGRSTASANTQKTARHSVPISPYHRRLERHGGLSLL